MQLAARDFIEREGRQPAQAAARCRLRLQLDVLDDARVLARVGVVGVETETGVRAGAGAHPQLPRTRRNGRCRGVRHLAREAGWRWHGGAVTAGAQLRGRRESCGSAHSL